MYRLLNTQLRAGAEQVAQGILDDIFLAIVQAGLYEILNREYLAPPFAPLRTSRRQGLGGRVWMGVSSVG